MANPTLDDDKESLKKERRRVSQLRWRKNNLEKLKATMVRWRKANPEKLKAQYQRRYKSNSERAKKAAAHWSKNNPDKCIASSIRWQKKNPEKVKSYRKKANFKYRSTPEGRLNNTISKHMNRCLPKTNQTASQLKHSLSYTISQLRVHLERQFLPGMSWDNRRDWHIDHIIPLSSFKFTSSKDPEFQAAWALSNLRPIWEKENLSKGKKKLTLL